MNEHADQPAGEPRNNGGIPGKTLQSQREAMGWTVEQVADQLKLAPRQVVALEAGDYASLPSPAVTRGFVRAYAKLLKIDAAPLVAMIEMNLPPQADAGATMTRREARPAAFSETRFPIGGKRSRMPLGWIAAAMVVVGAAAVAWNFGLLSLGIQAPSDSAAGDAVVLDNPVAVGTARNGPPAPATANGAAQAPLLNPSVPLITVPAPAPEGGAPAAAPGTAPAATAPVTPSVATPGAVTPPAGAPAAATTPAPLPAPAAPAAAPAGANTLVLNVREDSWIEVRPAKGGRPLISRLVKAGSTETVEVNEPVNLVVGAPSGVSATLRGASVALPPQPGKTISRVSLK